MKFSSEMVTVGENGPATPRGMKAMGSHFNKASQLFCLLDEVLVEDLVSFYYSTLFASTRQDSDALFPDSLPCYRLPV